VHTVNHITEYNPTAKGKTNLLKSRLQTESLMQSKYFDLSKYRKYHRLWGHDTKDCWTFKNKLEKMFKSGQLSLP